jgi:hypothetical protein
MITTVLLMVLIIGLAFLDYFTTTKILAKGGREVNPVMKWVINRGLFVYAKAFQGLLCAAAIVWGRTHYPLLFLIVGWIIVIGYGFVVVNNIFQLKKVN